jgi:predicted ATPase
LLEYPAVQLFLERVRQTHPEFRLTPSNLPVISRICQQLDGIPLALELAAGRVRSLSVEEIAERLQDRFKLLTGGSRAALPRQQTLRALIDWSYSLLEAGESRLLSGLSVFVGGWTLEAAEAVCAGEGKSGAVSHPSSLPSLEAWEILDMLTSLVDKSLVLAEEREGATRYRLLETIRQYGAEQLRIRREETALRKQHRDWYLAFSEEAKGKPDGAQKQWLDAPESGIAYVLYRLGSLAEKRGDDALARSLQRNCLEIHRELGSKPGIAQFLEAFANIVRKEGQPALAGQLWGTAERMREELDYPSSTSDRKRYDQLVAETRRALGEEAFSAAWSEGRAMSSEQATERALDRLPTA